MLRHVATYVSFITLSRKVSLNSTIHQDAQ